MPGSPKLLHVIGGGFNQVPLVETAKAMGMQVLVTDMYENPPARAAADLFEQVDTTDLDGTLAAARRHKIDYVVTDQTDVAVPTTAYVAETLGLPGIGYETALRFTNKYVMRKSIEGPARQHLPSCRYFAHERPAIDYCCELRNPQDYIIKPINSQGSKGVAKLNGSVRGQVATAFAESRGRGVLVERFVNGFEYSVEAFVADGKVHNLAVTKKYHFKSNPCIDERNTFLGDVSPELEEKLFTANTRIIEALKLPFGITHAEYKIEDGKVFLIEIAARGAGGSISSKIIPFLTDFDPLSSLLKVLTGKPLNIEIGDYKRKYAILKFFNFRPGRVKKVYINRSVVSNLLVFSFDLKDGDYVNPIRDSRDRPGYFVINGTDRDALLRQEKRIEAAVQVEYQ